MAWCWNWLTVLLQRQTQGKRETGRLELLEISGTDLFVSVSSLASFTWRLVLWL